MELSSRATHEYSRIAFRCCFDVSCPPADPSVAERTTLRSIEGVTNEQHVRNIATEKDKFQRWIAILTFAIRCISGLGPSGHAPAAVRLQDIFNYAKFNEASISPEGGPSVVERPPEPVMHQLRSVIGYAYYRRYATSHAERMSPAVTRAVLLASPIHELARAVKYAYLAAQGQLFTESAYVTFFALRDLARVLGTDLNKFRFWRRIGPVVAHREQEIILARLERLQWDGYTVAESMPACSMRECRYHKISRAQARRDRVLLIPCVGGCQIKTKPTYCGEDCRSSDFFQGHRKVCLGGFAVDGGAIPDTIAVNASTVQSLENQLAKIDDC